MLAIIFFAITIVCCGFGYFFVAKELPKIKADILALELKLELLAQKLKEVKL